jgi:propanol-preferring alcohol dehydrogenase
LCRLWIGLRLGASARQEGPDVLNGLTIRGSIVGTRKDLAEVYALHAQGRTRVIRETRKLEEVNECFEEVEKGDVKARIVFDLR